MLPTNGRKEFGPEKKNIPKKPLHIVAYDYGIKENILRLLVEHVGKVTVVNANFPIADVLEMDVDLESYQTDLVIQNRVITQ